MGKVSQVYIGDTLSQSRLNQTIIIYVPYLWKFQPLELA